MSSSSIWTGPVWEGDAIPYLSDNKIVVPGATGSASVAYFQPVGPDLEVSVVVVDAITGGGLEIPFRQTALNQPGLAQGGYFFFKGEVFHSIGVADGVGNFTTLNSDSGMTVGAGDTVTLRAEANVFTVFVNGVQQFQVIDEDNLWPDAGYAGVYLNGAVEVDSITITEIPFEERDYIIQGVRGDVPEDWIATRFTYQLWPAQPIANWWVWGQSTWGGGDRWGR